MNNIEENIDINAEDDEKSEQIEELKIVKEYALIHDKGNWNK